MKTFSTNSLSSMSIAKNKQKKIESNLGDNLINSFIQVGRNHKGNIGFQVIYSIKN